MLLGVGCVLWLDVIFGNCVVIFGFVGCLVLVVCEICFYRFFDGLLSFVLMFF